MRRTATPQHLSVRLTRPERLETARRNTKVFQPGRLPLLCTVAAPADGAPHRSFRRLSAGVTELIGVVLVLEASPFPVVVSTIRSAGVELDRGGATNAVALRALSAAGGTRGRE